MSWGEAEQVQIEKFSEAIYRSSLSLLNQLLSSEANNEFDLVPLHPSWKHCLISSLSIKICAGACVIIKATSRGRGNLNIAA